MNLKHLFVGGIVLYVLIFAALFPGRADTAAYVVSQGDSQYYDKAAVHLVESGFYSIDGETAYLEREPGYSLFLAIVYFVFGPSNFPAVYFVQGLLYLCAVLVLHKQLKEHTSERVAVFTSILALLSPGVFHSVFSLYREAYTLALLVFFTALLLMYVRKPSLKSLIGASVLLGFIILTYIPFLFLPFFLLIALWYLGINKQHIAIAVCIPLLIVALWGGRNQIQTGKFQLTAGFRTAAMWHARAEQARQLRGAEPFMCLWAEYISRDWSNRSKACSTNALIAAKWPGREVTGNEAQIAKEAQRVILQYLPYHLWFTIFEVLELHLPFVNGWGLLYNALAALHTVILYFGMLFTIPLLLRRNTIFFLTLIVYSIAVFSLTDTTPRYLIPVIFCYAVFAAIGYDRLLKYFNK